MFTSILTSLFFCPVGQRPSDPKQWATGTSAWGQKSPNSDVDWTPGTVVSSAGLAAGSGMFTLLLDVKIGIYTDEDTCAFSVCEDM